MQQSPPEEDSLAGIFLKKLLHIYIRKDLAANFLCKGFESGWSLVRIQS
jgi:hypothetical protein